MATRPSITNVFGPNGPFYTSAQFEIPSHIVSSLFLDDQQNEDTTKEQLVTIKKSTKDGIVISRFDTENNGDKVIYIRFPVHHYKFPTGCQFSIIIYDQNRSMAIKSTIDGDKVVETKNSNIKVDLSAIDHTFGAGFEEAMVKLMEDTLFLQNPQKICVEKFAAKMKSGPTVYLFKLPSGHMLISFRLDQKQDIEILCNDLTDKYVAAVPMVY